MDLKCQVGVLFSCTFLTFFLYCIWEIAVQNYTWHQILTLNGFRDTVDGLKFRRYWFHTSNSTDNREHIHVGRSTETDCSNYSCESNLRENFDMKFEAFFEEQPKLHLLYQYTNCPNTSNGDVLGGILETGWGFCSVLNNALNAYLLASEPAINRRFQLFFGHWYYSPLNLFFKDLLANTSCPLFYNLKDQNSSLLPGLANFSLTYGFMKGTQFKVLQFAGNPIVALRYAYSPAFDEIRAVMSDLQKRNGRKTVFRKKSAVLRAIWSPRPSFKGLLKKMWLRLIDPGGRYFGVHIRRGDKIWTKEMRLVPVDLYYQKILTLCSGLRGECPRNVFLMSDDENATLEFTRLAQTKFTVMREKQMMMTFASDIAQFMMNHRMGEGDRVFSEQRGKYMDVFTVEFISAVTLITMADQVICTHTSNVCRMIALLKGDLYSVHSLDVQWDSSKK